MILDILRSDFLRQTLKPYQLHISFETYCEIIKGERAMQGCYGVDQNGRLGVDIHGCPVYVIKDLDLPFKWLIEDSNEKKIRIDT
ncbi:hypothetical protein [Acinetobacter baumannii]|uniref:hypothetical protein n=1 Tax=Acinetobacter baumannii TaxID=470 RepID=UPI001057DA14|nr:hypothetical protein [Acinetobacter baumannii]MDC4500984.1 hypothetical protein [Acinetobacter baumannii]MDC4727116.1 hypothetical protein [Acinetobacter baumannii]MDC5008927.1 hypothetical protein [Acinetobacter baumannii]MDC5458761.1 hypothetical protein [Acinetobacter baumannii]MDC5481435.1 hypothetical protein [Acinetobacter baumannii]